MKNWARENTCGVILCTIRDLLGARLTKARYNQLKRRMNNTDLPGWQAHMENELGFRFVPWLDDPQKREDFWELFWRIYTCSMEAPGPVLTVTRDILFSDMCDPVRSSRAHPLWNK